ncbi:MAG: FHA domain-containing protein [Bacteriovoracaceae bacterium]|jgi:pSer/pThr/pTyr-binding forkhead associated (FHA) protein|nr:FHA domain-containing protein [Bacteriovoracaceae bacterium]
MGIHLILKLNDKIYNLYVPRDKALIIGRGDNADCRINNKNISKTHCKFYIEKKQIYIKDLDSKNGVILNGIKIDKQAVHLNDIINIGDCEIVVDRERLNYEALELLGNDVDMARDFNIELEQQKKTTENLIKKRKIQINKVEIKNKSYKKKNLIKLFLLLIIVYLVFHIFSD